MIYLIKEILPFGHTRTVQICNNESEVVIFLSRYVNKCKNLGEIKIDKVAL
jgi:hypothetical protein